MSFHDQVRSWGRRPSSRLVEAGVRPASAEKAAALQLTAAAPNLVTIVRVRLADDVPLAVEYACFPPHLTALLDADLETGSLHDRGLRPTLGSSVLTAQPAGRDAGRLLVGATEALLVESRMHYLTRMPVDILKMDRSFVRELNGTPEGAAVTEAVIRLSRALHLTTIAEGIGTAEQAAELRRLGCLKGQGYLYAPPLPAEQFAAARFAAAPFGQPDHHE